MEKIDPDGPKWGRDVIFPANTNLADILGRTDLDFDNLHVFHFLDPKFLDFEVPRSPSSQISRFPDFQTPPPDEFSDPNLTPLPTHPGIKYVARALAATFVFADSVCRIPLSCYFGSGKNRVLHSGYPGLYF